MEIILSDGVKSLTGCLGDGSGYSIRRSRNGRFYSHANPRWPRGYRRNLWMFIDACLWVKRHRLHISDIRIHWLQLADALRNTGRNAASDNVRFRAENEHKYWYNAADVENLKKCFGL